jgi:protein-disulfide isomerase
VDFKCPNSKAAAPILRQMMQKYGNKVKLIIRNFPVESTRAGANELAVLSMCAYNQGYYWPLHDWLYEQQDVLGSKLTNEQLDAMATIFGWDGPKIKECLSSTSAKVNVNKDFADAYRFGVGGTPTFFINGEKVEGVVPLEAWEVFLKNVK